jgi:hypothetical protein
MIRIIAVTALAALKLSDVPVHEPVRGRGDQVVPLPRRGAEVTGLTAAVEQVKHLVGGR